MVWDDSDQQQFLLLLDFSKDIPEIKQTTLLGIKRPEFKQLYRGGLYYSSDLYLEKSRNQVSICQNYNAAFESKNCHNRLLLLEFHTEWRLNKENSDFDSDINLLASREFYINNLSPTIKMFTLFVSIYDIITNFWFISMTLKSSFIITISKIARKNRRRMMITMSS